MAIRMPGEATSTLAYNTSLYETAKKDYINLHREDIEKLEKELQEQKNPRNKNTRIAADLYIKQHMSDFLQKLDFYKQTVTANPKVNAFLNGGAAEVVQVYKNFNRFENIAPDTIKAYQEHVFPIANHLLNVFNVGPDNVTQTPMQLMEKAINLDAGIRYATTKEFAVHDSMHNQKRALENIYSHGGVWTELDLEGIGTDIHEFALIDHNPAIKNAAHIDIDNAINSVIGMNDRQYKEALELIERYRQGGLYNGNPARTKGVNEKEELYKLQTLMKFGSNKTSLSVLKDGSARLTGYASDADIQFLDYDVMKKGADILHNLWSTQSQTLVDFNGKQVYGYEALLLGKLQQIKNAGTTISTHNGLSYDFGMLGKYFYGDQASTGAKEIFNSLTGGAGVSAIAPHFDINAVLREMNKLGWMTNDKKVADALAKEGADWNSSSALMYRFAGGREKVESTVREVMGGMYVQHAALSDTVAQIIEKSGAMETILNPDTNNKNYVFKSLGKTPERIAKSGDIFFVRSGMFSKDGYGSLSFTYDNMFNQFRFAGGVKVSADGATADQEIVGQGFKKGGLVMYAGTQEINVSDLTSAQIEKLGIESGQQKLYASFFHTYGAEGTARGENIQVYVSTLEKTQELLGGGLTYSGHIDIKKAAGQINKTSLTDDWSVTDWVSEIASGRYNNLVDTSEVDKVSKAMLSVDGGRYKFQDVYNYSEKIYANDTASNWLRNLNLNKWSVAEQYLSEVEKIARKNVGNGASITTEDIRNAASKLNQEALDPNDNGKVSSKLKRILAGKNGNGFIASNVADNLYRSSGYLWEMRNIYRLAASAANKFGNTNAEKNLYFGALFDNILSGIALNTTDPVTGLPFDLYGASGRNKVGMAEATYSNTLPRLGIQNSIFRVDISSLVTDAKKITRGNINSDLDGDYIDIDISSNSPHWKKTLLRKLSKNDTRADATSALRLLAGAIEKQYGFKIKLPNTPYDEANMAAITKALRAYRKENPNAGLTPDIVVRDLSGAADMIRIFRETHTEAEQNAIIRKYADESQIGKFIEQKGEAFSPTFAANNITDILFKESDAVTEKDLAVFGYSDTEIKGFLNDRDRRKQNVRMMMESVFEAAVAKNPYITYQLTKTGGLVFNSGNNQQDFSRYMVYDRFDPRTGGFYSQLGDRRMASVAGFVPNDINEGMHIASWVERYASEINSRIHTINAPNREADEVLRLLGWVFSDSAGKVSDLSTTRYDLQDARFGMSFDVSGYFNRLAYLNEGGGFAGYGFNKELQDTLDAMTKRLQRKKPVLGESALDLTPTGKELKVLLQNFDRIMSPLGEIGEVSREFFGGDEIARTFINEVYNRLDFSAVRHPENMIIPLTHAGLDSPFAGVGEDNRYISSVRTMEYDYEGRTKVMGDISKTLRPGRLLMTDMEAVKYDGLDTVMMDRAVRGRSLSLNTSAWAKIVDGATDKEKAEYKNLHALHVFLSENGGLIDPALLDLLPKSIMQKQKTDSLMDFAELQAHLGRTQAETELKIRIKTREVVKMTQDGIEFFYRGSEYVDAGSNIDYQKSWVGTANDIEADRRGFVERKIYDTRTNRILTQEEVTKLLNTKEALSELSGIKDSESLRVKAINYLESKGYVEKYTLESPDALAARKLLFGSEKSVGRAVLGHLGEFDPYISKLIGYKDGMRELYLSMDTIRNRSKLNKVLEAYGYNTVSKEAYERGFVQKAQAEQRKYFDFAKSLAKRGLGVGEDSAVGDVVYIGNLYAQMLKESHQELGGEIGTKLATAIEYGVIDYLGGGNASHTKEEVDKAYKAVVGGLFKQIEDKKIFTDEAGNSTARLVAGEHISVGNYTAVRTDALREILGQYIVDGENIKHSYDIDGQKAVLGGFEIASVSDANEAGLNRGGNKKGILATRRMTTALEQEVYSVNPMKSVWESYSRSYGAAAAQKFNEVYDGVASVSVNAAGDYSLTMADGATGSTVNKALIRNLHEEIIAGSETGRRLVGRNIKKLADDAGVDVGFAKEAISKTRKAGYADVGMDYISSLYAFETSRIADKINSNLRATLSNGERENIIQEMGKGMFEMLTLSEVASQPMQASGDNPNRLNRPVIIDLGDKVERLTGTKYIALPYQSFSVMNNRDGLGVQSQSEILKTVRHLEGQVQKFNANAGDVSGRTVEEIISSVNNLYSLVAKSITHKYGELANASSGYLYGSGMFKAGILDAADISNPLLRNVTYDGISIAEHAEAGRRVNIAFVGTDFFDNALRGREMENALKAAGMEGELEGLIRGAMDEAASTGAKGIVLRQPMEYLNSVQSTQIYLDRSLASNQMLMTSSMATGMKADMDGDLTYSHLIRARAQIFKDGKLVGTARLNELQVNALNRLEGLDVKFEELSGQVFKELRRTNDFLANASFSGVDSRQEEEKVEQALRDEYKAKNFTVDGKNYNFANMDAKRRLELTQGFEDFVQGDGFQTFLSEQGAGAVDDMDAKALADIANKYVATLSDAERDNVAQMFAKGIHDKALGHEIDTKLAHNNAGLVNMSTYRFKGIVNMLKNIPVDKGGVVLENEDMAVIGQLLAHLNEAGQASKNSNQAWTPEDLAGAMESFFGVNGESDPSKLYDIIDMEMQAGKGGRIGEFKNLPSYINVNDVSDVKAVLEKVRPPQGNAISRNIWDMFKLGYTRSEFRTDMLLQNDNDMGTLIQNTVNSIMQEHDFDYAMFRESGIWTQARTMTPHAGEELVTPESLEDIAPTISENISSAFKGLKRAFHGHGAMAMLGFAGATMLAGVMGGAPTAPPSAQGQAQGIQSDNAMYEIPSTMSSINNKPANQSYIINVNASTDRGRDFAETAIKQAFASVPQANQGINMTMNIKDSSSNIGYSDIASQVSSML